MEEFVYNAATACVVESYERIVSNQQGFDVALNRFREEIEAECLTLPYPLPYMGKKYGFGEVMCQRPVPTICLKASPTDKGIRYELDSQFKELLLGALNPRPATREQDLATLRRIGARWKQFREEFNTVIALNSRGLVNNSLEGMLNICGKSLKTGILLFTVKSTFKKGFPTVLDDQAATGLITVNEVVYKNESPSIQPVFSRTATHPLILLHAPAAHFADWAGHFHTVGPGITQDGLNTNSVCYDTVILDITEGADRFDDLASEQVATIKEKLASGQLRNVICLVRPGCFTEVQALQRRWQQAGRADIPVLTFHISDFQTNALLGHPPPDHGPQVKEINAAGFEEKQQKFRALLERLSALMRDSYGSTQISTLSNLRDLFYRYTSFYDQAAFVRDFSSFLDTLENLHEYVAGGLVERIIREARELYDIIASGAPAAPPLAATALEVVLQQAAPSGNKPCHLSIVSYNRNQDDQHFLAALLKGAYATTQKRKLNITFFNSRQLPSPLRNQHQRSDLLLVLNLPWEFAPLIHLDRYAYQTLVLADLGTLRRYQVAARKVNTVYDQLITDVMLAQVLNLPDDADHFDGRPHFRSLEPSVTWRPAAEEHALATSEGEASGEDIETLVSRLLQEIKVKETSSLHQHVQPLDGVILLLDGDTVLETTVSHHFYRLEAESDTDADSKADSGKVRAEYLQEGDDIVLFTRSNRADLNELIDESLRETGAYGTSLQSAYRWQQAIVDINRVRQMHLTLSEIFQQVGFVRTQATFDNYLRGIITKPGDLQQLLHAINSIGRTLYPGRKLLQFSDKDMKEIIAAVDQISHVRRMLPKAMREAAVFRRKGRSLMNSTYGTQIRPELLDAIMKEVSIRQVREVVLTRGEAAVCQ
jgi:hypothetical protein